jgi:hypothetical protein
MTAFEAGGYRDDIEWLEFVSIFRKLVTPTNMKMVIAEKTLSV